MANNNNNKTYYGAPLTWVIFIVFLILKLVGVISWSWWWVAAPLWIPAVLAILFFLGYLAYYGIKWIICKILKI